MEMMLQTQNLCKYFRKQKAVNNVSLNIEKGQIYGLLGPNGAGKSTTLKMLTGMMKPTAGKIYFDGKLLDRKDLSKIGALIENPPIYENLSARENLKVRQLLHGTEQFFMDDTSRNGEAHYGMGLFFAKTVAEKYGGGIKLSNSENTGGARVEIFFLSSQETS